MSQKQKYEELANSFLEMIGGKENMSYFTHCVTRLRVNIKDKGRVDIQRIENTEGVVGTQWAGEQLQLIIGQGVNDAYAKICDIAQLEKEEAIQENLDKKSFSLHPKDWLNTFMETISGIFAPFIPAIVACGLMQGLLYSIQTFGWISAESEIYTFLYTLGNAAFYFMPVLIAFAAAKKFHCNQYVAAALGAVLIHPTFMAMAGQEIHLFGFIPITYADYSSSAIPAILSVYFMSWVEKGCKKFVPNMIDIIVTPLISLVLAAVVGLAILAPLGNFLGGFIANGVMELYTTLGPIGGFIFAAAYPFILMTGMQVALSPIIAQNLATFGYDVLYPCTAASNAAMAAVALYIFFKAKKTNVKALGSSTGITALIGVTEPVLFGLVLKYKKVLWATMIGGAVGGAIMGIFTVKYLSFGFVPFGTLPLAMTDTFLYYLLGVGVAMITAVVALHFMKFED